MGKYEPIFWIILLYLLTPTMLNRWYIHLRRPNTYIGNFVFALCCIGCFFWIWEPRLSDVERNAIAMLWAPMIFLLLFKMADDSVKANYRRRFIFVNRYTQKDKEKHRGMDTFFTILLLILPFAIPLWLVAKDIL